MQSIFHFIKLLCQKMVQNGRFSGAKDPKSVSYLIQNQFGCLLIISPCNHTQDLYKKHHFIGQSEIQNFLGQLKTWGLAGAKWVRFTQFYTKNVDKNIFLEKYIILEKVKLHLSQSLYKREGQKTIFRRKVSLFQIL